MKYIPLLTLLFLTNCKPKRHDYILVISGTDTVIIYGGDNSIDMTKVKSSSGSGRGDTITLIINPTKETFPTPPQPH